MRLRSEEAQQWTGEDLAQVGLVIVVSKRCDRRRRESLSRSLKKPNDGVDPKIEKD